MTRAVWLLLAALSVARAGDRAELAGLIQDTSGGALVGATVAVVDQDSGIRRIGRSESEGVYVIPALPAGEFKVTVRKPGFQTVIRWNVKIEAGLDLRLDFVMQVGSMQQVISIHEGPPPINMSDGSVGVVIGRDVIESLPINGRGVMSLLELSPGVVATPAAGGEAGQFSANGLRANANYFTVDGVSANTSITGAGLPAQFAGAALPAMTAFGSTENLASMDALDEVQVLSSSFAPQYGRLPGAQVALTTRSGSDQYHGSASYAIRNEAADANDAFADANGLGKSPLRLNQGAAAVGGPVLANRTFFFVSYEWLHLVQPYTFPLATPSYAARSAAPSNLQPVLNAFPTPTQSMPSDLVAERIAHFSRPSGLDAASLRIDHALTGTLTLFARYNRAPSSTESGFSKIENFQLRSSGFTLGLSATPSYAISNDVRLNIWDVTATSAWRLNPASGSAPADFATALSLPPLTAPAVYGVAIGGVGAVYSGVAGAASQGQLNLVDTLSVARGAHALRFGVDYQRLTPARNSASESITGWWPNLESIIAGAAPVIASTSADQASSLVETLSVFAQDTWSVSSRLNLTYGLRWEITPPPSVQEPAAAAAGRAVAAPVSSILPVAPATQALWRTSYGQFAPRIGAAWRLNDQSVLRAGWGVFYDTGFSTALDPINGFPFNRWQFSLGEAAPPNGPGYGLRVAPNLKLPYAAEWNISLERMFGLHNVVSASYVGSSGRRLLRYEGVPQANTGAAQVATATNHGLSRYDAFELEFRRRLAQGLRGLAAYTWSHAIDNGSYDSGVYVAAGQLPASADRGSSSFDARHNLTAGFTYEPARNWDFSAMLRARTGFPIDIQTTESYFGLGFDDIGRPNLVAGVPIWLPAASLGVRRLNPAAFSPPAGIEGDLGRNAITGFGMWQLDLAAERRFRLFKEGELQVRLEAYNALNHPDPADPVRFLDSPFFGASTSMLNLMLGTGTSRSGLTPAFQVGGPRSLQLSVRIRF